MSTPEQSDEGEPTVTETLRTVTPGYRGREDAEMNAFGWSIQKRASRVTAESPKAVGTTCGRGEGRTRSRSVIASRASALASSMSVP